ncbi:MAG: hypothetical protein ACFCGT_15865 [Sandaracinaceae bacterium]
MRDDESSKPGSAAAEAWSDADLDELLGRAPELHEPALALGPLPPTLAEADEETAHRVARDAEARFALAFPPDGAGTARARAALQAVADRRARRRRWLVAAAAAAAVAAALLLWVRPDAPAAPGELYVLEVQTRGIREVRGERPGAGADEVPVVVPYSEVRLLLRPARQVTGPRPDVALYAVGPHGELRAGGPGAIHRRRSGAVLLEAGAGDLFGSTSGLWTIHVLIEPAGNAETGSELADLDARRRFTVQHWYMADPDGEDTEPPAPAR